MDIKAYIESGVIEAYVLGMADAQEAARLEQLSSQYPEIRKAIDAFEISLEKKVISSAVQVPLKVKETLLTKLSDDFKGAKPQAAIISTAWSRYVAAASIILLLASAVLNIYYYNRFRSASTAYQALLTEKNSLFAENQNTQTKILDIYESMRMMSDPAMIKVSMPGVKGKENNLATVFWDSRSKDVYLLPNKLPETASDQQYQLWAIVDGKPVDAGVIGSCAGLCKMKNIPIASMFAITLEKKGGSINPTMNRLLVAGKVG